MTGEVTKIRENGATGQMLDTSYSYDLAGRVLSVDGPLAGSDDATHNRYDVHGRRTWEIGALAPNGLRIATRTTYRDSDDKPITAETGTIPNVDSTDLTVFRRTDFAYDPRRNPERETVSGSGTTHSVVQRTFDARGRLDCEARRMNPAAFASPLPDACALGTPGSQGADRITHNIYDDAGQLLVVQRSYQAPLQQNYATYTYSPNGRQTSVTDANGNRAEMTYDGFDRQRRWIFPHAGPGAPNQCGSPGAANPCDFEEYGYDAAGNRTSLRKRDGSVLTYQYDALNRMLVKVVPERAGLAAAHTRDVHYGYDVRGLQIYARFDSATGEGITNAWDGFGRLASTTINLGGVARTLTSLYDTAGNRAGLIHPGGNWFGIWYDALARPYYLHANGTTGISYTYYHPHGAPFVVNRGNPAASAWFYDTALRPAGIVHYLAGGEVSWNFGYNPANQITSRLRHNPGSGSGAG